MRQAAIKRKRASFPAGFWALALIGRAYASNERDEGPAKSLK
jgi:hypothetical protein